MLTIFLHFLAVYLLNQFDFIYSKKNSFYIPLFDNVLLFLYQQY